MEAFLLSLAELGQWRPSQVKLIITSRPVVAVERPLRMAKMELIRLEEKMVDMDIATYVQYRLATSSIPVEDHVSIMNAVPGRAYGLFLYAKLAMNAFLEPGADVQKVLQELPADLNVIYTDILREHAPKGRHPGPHPITNPPVGCTCYPTTAVVRNSGDDQRYATFSRRTESQSRKGSCPFCLWTSS